jgi:D-sedoheptulose 7-phosphate isomerase
MKFVKKYLDQSIKIIDSIDIFHVEKVINIIKSIKENKGRIFFIGSGGGAGHASHAVNDFRKICNIECYSPSDNVSELTARINDDGWDTSYSNWLKVSRINSSDLVFVLSVGGGDNKKNISKNIINSIKIAKKANAKVVGIVGKAGGYTARNSDASIIIPVVDKKLITPHTESFQALIWHLIVSHPSISKNKTKWESVGEK